VNRHFPRQAKAIQRAARVDTSESLDPFPGGLSKALVTLANPASETRPGNFPAATDVQSKNG
jgi:hypothetical protein